MEKKEVGLTGRRQYANKTYTVVECVDDVIYMRGTGMDEWEGLCVKFCCVYVQTCTRGSVSMVICEHKHVCAYG